jgi:hypothetical protein
MALCQHVEKETSKETQETHNQKETCAGCESERCAHFEEDWRRFLIKGFLSGVLERWCHRDPGSLTHAFPEEHVIQRVRVAQDITPHFIERLQAVLLLCVW